MNYLSICYINALKLAEEHSISSLAFPAISTGIFGYPMREAAKVAFSTIKDITPNLNSVKDIRFVLYSQSDLELHRQVMNEVFEKE